MFALFMENVLFIKVSSWRNGLFLMNPLVHKYKVSFIFLLKKEKRKKFIWQPLSISLLVLPFSYPVFQFILTPMILRSKLNRTTEGVSMLVVVGSMGMSGFLCNDMLGSQVPTNGTLSVDVQLFTNNCISILDSPSFRPKTSLAYLRKYSPVIFKYH